MALLICIFLSIVCDQKFRVRHCVRQSLEGIIFHAYLGAPLGYPLMSIV